MKLRATTANRSRIRDRDRPATPRSGTGTGAGDLRLVLRRSSATRGRLVGAGLDLPCAIGRSGLTSAKREGDGATPRGRLAILGGVYRADRLRRPRCALELRPLRRDDGWCDAPGDANYNRPVRLPYRPSHEAMWRDDGLYDVVLVLGWNIRPRAQGRGSAIFFHLARPDHAPTAGCIALTKPDMLRLLPRLRPGAAIIV
ncbi:L,D-transpeptidase family protein [Methylobrevis albus]|uniref:L,D-transpeptidase family protein n=1 Tax=Methylobrevis albus TaxID=2793297 RepID=A0A931HZW4_9HYPH|nr:L,D-transpeptidase family protein [Methylobrevis albus]